MIEDYSPTIEEYDKKDFVFRISLDSYYNKTRNKLQVLYKLFKIRAENGLLRLPPEERQKESLTIVTAYARLTETITKGVTNDRRNKTNRIRNLLRYASRRISRCPVHKLFNT